MVKLVVPLNVAPFMYNVGLDATTFPPKVDDGPNVKLPVPVNAKFCAVLPDCVNCFNNNVPAENPPAPTEIVLFAAKVAVAVLLPPQNCTPCPFVEVTTILSLNEVFADNQPT